MTLKTYKRLWQALPLVALALLLQGCYSFSGTSIPADVKTMAIVNFSNPSGQGPADIQNSITEDFKNYFQRNTTLRILPQGGDLQIEGQILSYSFSPAAIQRSEVATGTSNVGIDQAGANRLTIVVQITYTDTKNPVNNFEQSFSNFTDFPPSQDINQITRAQIQRITDQIVYSVFTKTAANW